MVLQIYFSDDEIRAFFEGNGFDVKEKESGEWIGAVDKRNYVNKMQLFVSNGSRVIEARKLFERITEKRMRRYLTPISLESKRIIESEIKNLLK